MAIDEANYRPVSAAAVGAVVVGAASALALANPFFWIVPLVGIAVACLGLADVRRPGAEKAGRMAALVGLALSVGFGVQALSSAATTRLVTAGRARVAAERWLETIRAGRTADAESMCQPETTAAVAKLAGRLAECEAPAFRVRGGGSSEEVTGGLVVRAATLACRSGEAGSALAVTIHVVPETMMRRGRPVERWTIARCDIE